MSWLKGWVRVALRDLRGDLKRFAILLACLALGVATITLVGSVGAALQSALLRDARTLLGGDLEATLTYRAANAEERALFQSLGQLSEVVEVQGRADGGSGSSFLAIKAVDAGYPLIGTLTVEGATEPLPALLAERDGRFGLVADPLMFDRLGLKVGDPVTVGEAEFTLTGVLGKLPDQVTTGIQFGLPVLISVEALNGTGILAPGVLATYRYKVLLNPGTDFETAKAAIETRFPTVGWKVNAPRDATADLARFFDIFARFLTIVGLSSLLVGGVGVSNAISAYVTERQRSIATMKALGATGPRILFHFLTQVMLLTVAGIAVGLIIGTLLSMAILPILGGLLSVNLPPVVDIGTLWTAAGFGALVGFAFGYLPLVRAEKLKPALLFRSAGSAVEGGLGWSDLARPSLWLPLGLAALGIYLLAALTTGRPLLVLWYAVAVILAFLVLRGAGWLLQRGLKLIPPAPNAALRNAVKAIYRPGAPAPVVILSLGLGLALLLLIALIDANLRHQLNRESIPNAPSFVFMDLFDDEVEALKDFTVNDKQVENFASLPMVTGAIESINGVPVAELGRKPPSEFAFVLEGEIPLTASEGLPDQSEITEGSWWPPNFIGPPEVSVFERLKGPLGLKLGDEITFRIFGEPVTVKIGSFRDYAWRSGSVNFGFVLSPNALADFPLSYLGLLKASPGHEREVQQRLVADFPDLLFLPVGEALETFAALLANVTTAVEVIGGLAVVSGVLVLAGAMAAGRKQREADAVVTKVLGATRGDVIRAFLVEYGVLGLLAAVLAAILGLVGTWAFVEYVLEIDFWADLWLIVWVAAGTIVLAVVVGMLTTWSALSIRPSRFLREE
ncbi:FtsX-like permease family protein [Devosia sp. ZB163]|uniref:ABC transporter permease n=1 Tax=Devosia sp. ZB163 TaxID=3025938 RepID=UPI00235FEF42|nr:FtsX-like permease family protein [Devosia sp. ZB163]MDC9822165.1 FtsX-like permease family protein [Devosia sp. ZB163]